MRENLQLAQRSKRLVAERLNRHLSEPASTRAVCVGARLENPLGVAAARSVEACRKALLACLGRRGGSSLLPDAAEQLAKGAQENALQHHCASSAFSLSPSIDSPIWCDVRGTYCRCPWAERCDRFDRLSYATGEIPK